MPLFSALRRQEKRERILEVEPMPPRLRPQLRSAKSDTRLSKGPALGMERSVTAYSQPHQGPFGAPQRPATPQGTAAPAPAPPQHVELSRALESHRNTCEVFVGHIYQSEPDFWAWAAETRHGGPSSLTAPPRMRRLPMIPWTDMVTVFIDVCERTIARLERHNEAKIVDLAEVAQATLQAAHEFNRLTCYLLGLNDQLSARLKVRSTRPYAHGALHNVLLLEGTARHLPDRAIWQQPLHVWGKLLETLETSPLRGERTMKLCLGYWASYERELTRMARRLDTPQGRFVMPPAAARQLEQNLGLIRDHIAELQLGFDDGMMRKGWPVQRPLRSAPLLPLLARDEPSAQRASAVQRISAQPPALVLAALDEDGDLPFATPEVLQRPLLTVRNKTSVRPRQPTAADAAPRLGVPLAEAAPPAVGAQPLAPIDPAAQRMVDEICAGIGWR